MVKRAIIGTFHKVNAKYMPLYGNEFEKGMLKVRVFALLAVLTLACSSSADEKKEANSKPAQSAQTTAKSPAGTQDAPVVIEVIPPPKIHVETTTNEAEAKEKASNESLLTWSTIWLAFATTLLMGFTFALWRSTARIATDAKNSAIAQANRMEESVKESARAAKAMEQVAKGIEDSAIAAHKSADTARDTLDELKDNAERQLRAYVLVHAVGIANIDGTLQPVASVVIRNFGLTPAHDLTCWTGMVVQDYSPSPELQFRVADRLPEHVLGPGAHLTKRADQFTTGPVRPLSETELSDLRAGRKAFYVFGEIHYRDAFDRERETVYRFMIGGPIGISSNGSMVNCEEGNYAN